MQAGNIIRSNGLTTSRYNELSHILGKRKDIRERVQHQAYLYRVNADLRGDKIHPLVDLPETTPRRDRRDKGQQVPYGVVRFRFLCFLLHGVFVEFSPEFLRHLLGGRGSLGRQDTHKPLGGSSRDDAPPRPSGQVTAGTVTDSRQEATCTNTSILRRLTALLPIDGQPSRTAVKKIPPLLLVFQVC